ncbi:hypothetical protein AB7Z32_10245 [Bradyrhizobium sp. 482_C4_N1_1]|uniref:hypothetical protein n=1 Tax=unclassified Bradyrhizobium TaxID=2631580 RepID=UPI003F8A29D2
MSTALGGMTAPSVGPASLFDCHPYRDGLTAFEAVRVIAMEAVQHLVEATPILDDFNRREDVASTQCAAILGDFDRSSRPLRRPMMTLPRRVLGIAKPLADNLNNAALDNLAAVLLDHGRERLQRGRQDEAQRPIEIERERVAVIEPQEQDMRLVHDCGGSEQVIFRHFDAPLFAERTARR